MRTLLALAAAVAAAAVATPSLADTSASVGYSSLDTDRATVSGITGRLTWTQGWYGLEGELTVGTGDDTARVGATTAKVKLQREESVYARAQWPMQDNFDVFVRLGYTNTHFSDSGLPVRRNGSNQAFSYGVGAEWFLDSSNGLRVDWTGRDYKAIDNGNLWSVSYVRKF